MPPKGKGKKKKASTEEEKPLQLSYLPMGQNAAEEPTDDQIKSLKREWNLPYVPSFEVWQAVTCYDSSQYNGGETFQKQMYMVLTPQFYGQEINRDVTDHFQVYDEAENTARARPNNYKPAGTGLNYYKYPNKKGGGTNEAHGPKTLVHHPDRNKLPGLNQVAGSDGGSVGYWATTVQGENAAKDLQAGHLARGYGYVAWWESAGMDRKVGSCDANTNARQGFGPYEIADEKTQSGERGMSDRQGSRSQSDGCIVMGNRFAAYYGLYFYPGCHENRLNWHRTVMVDGKNFIVRERYPNPAYKIEGKKLMVYEPANYPDDATYVGGNDGFEFPRLDSYRLSWNMLVRYMAETKSNSAKNSKPEALRLFRAPIGGYVASTALRDNNKHLAVVDIQEGSNIVRWNETMKTVNTDAGMVPTVKSAGVMDDLYDTFTGQWEGRMHKREDRNEEIRGVQDGGLAFGWSVPTALFLYPHHSVESTGPVKNKLFTGNLPTHQKHYQPWPGWRTGEKVPRSSWAMNQFGLDKPLVKHFTLHPLLSEYQKFALGLPDYATVPNNEAALFDMLKSGVDPTPEPPAAPIETPMGTINTGTAQQDANVAEADRIQNEDADDDEQAGARAQTNDNEKQTDPTKVADQEDGLDESHSFLDEAGKSSNYESKPEKVTDGDWKKYQLSSLRVANLQPLEAGAAKRKVNEATGNDHFFSLSYSPWPPEDCYEPNYHAFDVSERLNEDEIEKYKKRYGNTSNLLLRSTYPYKINDVKQAFGELKMHDGTPILEMRLDSYRTLPDGELRETFRRNMRRILSIYFDDSGNLGSAGSCNISVADKRKGMLNGMFMLKQIAKFNCHPVSYENGNAVEKILPAVFDKKPVEMQREIETMSVQTLKAELRKRKIQFPATGNTKSGLVGLLQAAMGGNNVFTDGNKLWRGKPEPSRNFLDADVDDVQSKMTVLQWLQTPWHYEYLPYQPKNSVFKDGETYCAGCTRCSRPFYEYEHLYASYFNSEWPSAHWPYLYWRYLPKDDFRVAPLPFHDELFWSTKEYSAYATQFATDAVGQFAEGEEEREIRQGEQRGFHNWPTHAFLMGYKEENGELVKDDKPPDYGPLRQEACNRHLMSNCEKDGGENAGKGIVEMRKILKKPGRYFTFRKYINHTYDPEVKKAERYYTLVQGVVRNRNSKIAYGMRDYRLMRSIKYGNVCRDCMATLDTAPGLYRRAGRVQAAQSLLSSGQVRPGATQLDTWWLALKDVELVKGPPKQFFDPWFIYVQTGGLARGRTRDAPMLQGPSRNNVYEQLLKGKPGAAERLARIEKFAGNKEKEYKEIFGTDYEAALQLHLDAVVKWTQQRSCLLQDREGKNYVTKVLKPPEIYVQKAWDEKSTMWNKLEAGILEDATKFIEAMIKWLDASYRDPKPYSGPAREPDPIPPTELPPFPELSIGRANRALRDVFTDAAYTIGHLSAYKRDADTSTTKYDPNLTREEYRDWDNGDGYRNCLRVVQMVRPDYQKRVLQQGEEAGYIEKVETLAPAKRREVIYRYDKEKQEAQNTDWRGDDYVQDEKNENRGDPWTMADGTKTIRQIRKHTQSRVFITYSLHRRVYSELEARKVLEQMADALRTLFGNDQELCRIVLFGHKLQPTANDSVSAYMYTPILKPRKSTTTFYGGANGYSSYIYDTYQTHVESVTVDAGVEIGPTYHHPHFHALVTINHWSYVQIDTSRMKSVLEQMFKGTHFKYRETFMLKDGAGLPFYTDNENPYVDIRLYPTDNWADVISAYVRKGADKESIMALRARTGQTNPAGSVSGS
jgi:hypothetical protein